MASDGFEHRSRSFRPVGARAACQHSQTDGSRHDHVGVASPRPHGAAVKRIVLGLSFVLATSFACAEDDPTLDNDAKVVNVQVTSNQFTPATLTIRAGQTVLWTWAGGEHNVVSGTCDDSGEMTPDDQFRSGAPASGGTYERLFSVPGTYPYYCEPHCAMGMRGEIKVE